MKTIGDYKLKQFLGRGSYGEIYLGQKGNDPLLYAVKVLDKKKMDSPKMKKYLDAEIEITKELSHPNIVHFYEKLADDTNYYLIMEYCNGGTLNQCMEKYMSVYKEPFSLEIIQNFMRQIISAFCHIHSHNIIHRDIKLDNILLSYENESDIKNLNLMKANIKIIDFGVAIKLDSEEYAFTAVGTPLTMDPLILKKYAKAGGYEKLQGYNEKADVWSLGSVFYNLLTGKRMFTAKTKEEFVQKVESGNYVVPIDKSLFKEPISFLNCMLQYDPEDRISVHNLAQHDFITKNIKSFTKADLSKIFYKIDKNGLNINHKLNESICKVFNSDKAINQLKNNSAHNSGNNKLIGGNVFEDGSYCFNGDIYGLHKSCDNNQININDPINARKRFSAGDASLSNGNKKELTKFEEELIETLKLDKENEEKDKKDSKIEISNKNYNDNTNEKEEVKIYIKGLLDEYKSAKEYFNKNGLTLQEKDANEKVNLLQNYLEKYEKYSFVCYESLPKPITPEYIYNIPTSERNSIFQQIIAQYIEKKAELEAFLKCEVIKYQKMDKSTFLLLKNDIMSKLENERTRLDKYKQIIELFQKRYNNIWTPLPEITKSIETGKHERISFEGCIFKLILHTTKNNYYNDKNRFSIKFNMKINDNKNYFGEVNILSYGNYEEDVIWNLQENEWNNLTNYFINVDFYLDNCFKGNQKINITKLKECLNMKISYPISFLNQQGTAYVNFDIKIIMPEGKKITSIGKREIINIKKSFKPFEGKSPYTNKIPRLFQKNK